jgi:DNA repair protein RadD
VIEERPYQIEGRDSVFNYWAEGGGNPLVEMATGTGKSVVIGSLTKNLLTTFDGLRVIVLTHVKELVAQDAQAALKVWPQMPFGINSAGLNRRDKHSQVLFASIQSVYRIGDQLGPRDVVIIDECHLLPRDGEGMYRTLLDTLRERVPDLRVVGFTATPYRLDSGRLDEGTGRLFDEVVYSYDLARGVDDGFLSPLIAKATTTEIDTTGVKRSGGEFNESALAFVADRPDVIQGACDEILRHGVDRRAWLAFCTGIEHAEHVRDALRQRGVSCETVSSKTPSGERDRFIRAYKAGQIKCLTNANVLTTGFDAPHVDMIAMLRPTLSTGLYVQTLGRGTRLSEGKRDCLVLDFAGNVRRHGPVDAVVVTKKKVKGGKGEKDEPDQVRAKICPDCQTYNAISALTCICCGFQWPKPEPKHSDRADTEPVMTREIKDKWIAVDDVRIDRHRKFGDGPDSLKVEYVCAGGKTHTEWVCLEHGKASLAYMKATMWWYAMGGQKPAPDIDNALARGAELHDITGVMIMRDGKYWRVQSRRIKDNDGHEFKIDDKLRVVAI